MDGNPGWSAEICPSHRSDDPITPKCQHWGISRMTEGSAPLAKSWTTSWLPVVGLFLLPTFFALLQGWASQRTGVAWNVTARLLSDGRLYLTQALQLQDEPVTPLRILEFGLYPLFLS